MRVKWLLIAVGFIALGFAGIHMNAFSVLPGGTGVPGIESHLQDNAEQALKDAGLSWAQVTIHGQQAHIGGTAPAQEDIEKARDVVLHSIGKGGLLMGGISRVKTDQVTLKKRNKDAFWQAQKQKDAQWHISGHIRQSTTKDAVRKAILASGIIAPEAITDVVKIVPDLPLGWDKNALRLLGALLPLDVGIARMSDEAASVNGKTDKAAIKSKSEQALRDFAPPIRPTVNITLVKAVSAPPEPVNIYDKARCQQLFQVMLAENNIQFASSKAVIKPQSLALMDSLADIADKCAAHEVHIIGHTDQLGDPAFNDYLSQLRAEAVKTYFVGKGLNAESMSARGNGAKTLLCQQNTRSCRQRNRRIEIVVE